MSSGGRVSLDAVSSGATDSEVKRGAHGEWRSSARSSWSTHFTESDVDVSRLFMYDDANTWGQMNGWGRLSTYGSRHVVVSREVS